MPHTDDDPNEDGFVINTDSSKYCVDPNKDLFLIASDTAGNRRRSYVEWELGGNPQPIPAGSNVTYVKILFEVTQNSSSYCYYRGLMTNRPSLRNGSQIWGDIDAYTFSVTNNEATKYIGQNRQVVLGANDAAPACTQLETKLGEAEKWFAVGIRFASESGSREVKAKAEEYGADATPKPKLYVEFT